MLTYCQGGEVEEMTCRKNSNIPLHCLDLICLRYHVDSQLFLQTPKYEYPRSVLSSLFQSDFPKDSDMVESFQCTRTQTSRWVGGWVGGQVGGCVKEGGCIGCCTGEPEVIYAF